MTKRNKVAERRFEALLDGEFYQKIRSAVNNRRSKCRETGEKSPKWFRELAALASEMAKAIPGDSYDLLTPLRAVSQSVKNVGESKPSSFSKPFTKLLDELKTNEEMCSTSLLEHFDKLRELVYRQPERKIAQTDTDEPSEQDTVQEFERTLSQEEIAEITEAKQWAEDLSLPEDRKSIETLLFTSTQDILLYLKSQGYGVNELSRILEIPPSSISGMARGKTQPPESASQKIRKFLISIKK